jgi:glycosyltransferase involved in cell wall biosynthesis
MALRLLVVEPEATGHRLALYARYVVREAKKRGWDVGLLTTEHAKKHPAYRLVELELGVTPRVFTMPRVPYPTRGRPWALLWWQASQHRSLKAAFRVVRAQWAPDLAFMVTLDYIDKVMPVLGSPFDRVTFGGILLSPTHHHGRLGLRPKRWRDFPATMLFHALLRIDELRFLLTIDEPLAEESSRKSAEGSASHAKVRFLPDAARPGPGNETRDLNTTAGHSTGRLTILVYGSVTARKGIAQLFQALEYPAMPSGATAVLAGEPDDTARALLDGPMAQRLRNAGRLIERLHFLDDAEEREVFQRADIVWLGYSRFTGMSGVLLLAGAMKKPVVACKDGLIGWYASRYRTGPIVDPDDTPGVAAAIGNLSDHGARESYARNGWRLSQRHTPEIFSSTICDAIESVMPRTRR